MVVLGHPRPQFRAATTGLSRYIATIETSKHRFLVFLPIETVPDSTLVTFAFEDARALGVLSSRLHATWALAAGGRLGVGNDPRYNKTRCFETFPFPDPTPAQRTRIRELGEALDAHRKRQQAAYPDLTITGMYNVLEKLRSGEKLTAKEKVIHEHGLVSVLKQIHDDLDAAVFDAYGWPHDLTDEQILEKLVALNAERAEEERRGLVRWLRPEYQAPAAAEAQPALVEELPVSPAKGARKKPAAVAASPEPWPKSLAERVAAVRTLVARASQPWSVEDVKASFTRARLPDVQEVLDALVALGLLVAYDTRSGRRWRAASRPAA